MNDAGGVGAAERVGDANGEAEGLAEGKGLAGQVRLEESRPGRAP